MTMQTTIRNEVTFTGVGLHSGKPVCLTVLPDDANRGIRFFVRPHGSQKTTIIPALADRVTTTAFATTLSQDGVSLHTVEHILSALAGLNIDNAMIQVDSNEIPIMDGSAAPFVAGLLQAGTRAQSAPRRVVHITTLLRAEDGNGRWIEIHPTDRDHLSIDYAFDFCHPLAGDQQFHYQASAKAYTGMVARARTFGRVHEVEALQQAGMAQGASLDNGIGFDEDSVLNTDGLRFTDETVRHKVLDLIGDLSLVGQPVLGHIVAHRAGHDLHTRLAQLIREQAMQAAETPQVAYAVA